MLSHMNDVDPFIFRCVFLYKIQNCIFHAFNQHMSHRNGNGLEISFLYDEESIKLKRDQNLFKKKPKNIYIC